MNTTRATFVRVVVTLVASASIALAGAASVHAADPTEDTIGLTVYPAPIHAQDGRTLTILNEGTVPMAFTFEAPAGWSIEPATVTIDAGATAKVELTGRGDDGTLLVKGTAAELGVMPQAAERSVVAMQVRVYAGWPFDPSPWIWGALMAALIVLALVFVARRVRRVASRYTITRKES